MKEILFTGARSGIAHSVIKKLLTQDYKIHVTVHTDKQLELVKNTYNGYENINCFKLDITSEEDLKKLEDLDIDILVNNAALGTGGSIAEIPIELVRESFEVNVISNFRVVQIVLKKMMKKGEGRVIMMSSLARLLPYDFLGVYSATKASISTLTYTLRNELNLLDNNIKIILIEPGAYYTGFNQVMLDNKYKWMYKNSYFDSYIDKIRERENDFFNNVEKINLNSIANKIEKAITCDEPKFLYRAPFCQTVISKILNFIVF